MEVAKVLHQNQHRCKTAKSQPSTCLMVPRDLQESFVLRFAAAFGHDEDKDRSEIVLKQLQSTSVRM